MIVFNVERRGVLTSFCEVSSLGYQRVYCTDPTGSTPAQFTLEEAARDVGWTERAARRPGWGGSIWTERAARRLGWGGSMGGAR